jgi:hypothetical protein
VVPQTPVGNSGGSAEVNFGVVGRRRHVDHVAYVSASDPHDYGSPR